MAKTNRKLHAGIRTFGALSVAGLLACGLSFAAAQSTGGPFSIRKHTIDGGGHSSAGGSLALSGTFAQPEASPERSVGDRYRVIGGFWAPGTVVPLESRIFKDRFQISANELNPIEPEENRP